MAAMDFQVNFNNSNNLPRDRYVNTLYYDATAAGPEPICDGIAAAYVSHILGFHGGQIGSMTINAYPPGRNPGGPAFSKKYAYAPSGSGSGPAEVALCLSYYADTNQPRNRGRVFLGPFSASAINGERPEPRVMNAALAWARAIAAIGGGNVANWLQRSATDNNYSAVSNFYVDNAWDTQRRRGAQPNGRLTGSI